MFMKFAVLIALSLAAILTRGAAAQSFTYQGQLTTVGGPATTAHDFTFKVFDAVSGGTQVGATTTVFDLLPENGLFTATISPGADVFTGLDRWLEIATRPTAVGTFTTLFPRQRISAAPYAIKSLTDRWTDLGGGRLTNVSSISSIFINRTTAVTGADYFSVRTPTGQQAFGGMYIDTAAGDGFPFYGYSTGNTVRGFTYIDGATGTWHLSVSGNRVSVTNTGRVGIATQPTGPERVQVSGDVRVAGIAIANELRYVSPQTRYLMLGAEDFRAANSAQQGQFGEGPEFSAFLDPSVAYGEMVAPVHLPDGAQVTEMICYMFGPTTTNPLRAELEYRQVDTLDPQVMATASTLGQAGTNSAATLVAANNTPINNAQRSYCVRVRASDWTTSHSLRHIRIAYTVAKPD